MVIGKNLHLLNCDGVQLYQPVFLGQAFINKKGVEVFQIGETNQLGDIGIISDIALLATAFLTPFLCCQPEQSHIQDIGFTGVNIIDLCLRHLPGNQIFFNSVRMDAIVDFGQISLDIPAELLSFILFKPLEFLDKIELKFNGYL